MDWSIMSAKDRKEAIAGIIKLNPRGVSVEQIANELKGFRMNISTYKVLLNMLRIMERERIIERKRFVNTRSELYFSRR